MADLDVPAVEGKKNRTMEVAYVESQRRVGFTKSKKCSFTGRK